MKKEADALKKKKAEAEKKAAEVKTKIVSAGDANLDELKESLKTIEQELAEVSKQEEEHKKKEKLAPWNVDTISQPGFAKTVINKKAPRPEDEQLTDDEREARMRKFVKDNEKDLKHYGMLRRYDDSRKFLKEHLHLVSENTANYLVIWCINLEMEEVSVILLSTVFFFLVLEYLNLDVPSTIF